LVFIDESGFSHSMPRMYGYSSKGKRCYGSHDWGARGRTNVIGALIGKELLVADLFNHNINTMTFNRWVTESLIPKLPNNSVLIMDNASFHKGIEMKNHVEKAGHILVYLPPYSPDLNPIEHKWAEKKAERRKTQVSIKQLFEKENRNHFICV
jgi:transposase